MEKSAFQMSTAARVGLTVAILVSFFGAVLSAVLLQRHVAVEIGAEPMLSGVCTMLETTSCDEVLASEWATFRGVPTALLGLFFFASMLSWYLVIGVPSPSRRRLQIVPVLASAVGAGIAAGLAYVMYRYLPKWCPLCAGTHVAAGLLFILSLLLWPKRAVVEEGKPATPVIEHPTLRVIVAALVLAMTTSAFAWSEYHRRLEKRKASEYFAKWQFYESDHAEVYRKMMMEPEVQIPVTAEDSIRGAADAPHTVVVFTDFQCPHCRDLDKLLKGKLEANNGKFRLVFKHFPMNADCNTHVTARTHAGSCAAAVTAEAVRTLGGEDAFWKMHDELFANQAAFARRPKVVLQEAAGKLGLDTDAIWSKINTTSAWDRVRRHTDQGHAVGVKATPTVFYDGRKVEGYASSKFWDFLFFLDRQKEREQRAATQPASRPATRPM